MNTEKKLEIKEKLVNLVSRFPDGLYNKELPDENMYGEDLTHIISRMGCTSALNLLSYFKDVIKCVQMNDKLYIKLNNPEIEEEEPTENNKNDVSIKLNQIPHIKITPEDFTEIKQPLRKCPFTAKINGYCSKKESDDVCTRVETVDDEQLSSKYFLLTTKNPNRTRIRADEIEKSTMSIINAESSIKVENHITHSQKNQVKELDDSPLFNRWSKHHVRKKNNRKIAGDSKDSEKRYENREVTTSTESNAPIMIRWSQIKKEDRQKKKNSVNQIQFPINNAEIEKAFEAFELYDSKDDYA